VIHYYREGILGIGDPHFNFYYTLRFVKVLSLKNFEFPEVMGYPVFVGVGEIDELFSESGSRKLFEEVPSENKEFAVLPGAKHAHFIDNSFNPLFNWIDTTFEK
jgi:esterase/lipase